MGVLRGVRVIASEEMNGWDGAMISGWKEG